MRKVSTRQRRINQLIQEELTLLIRDEIDDPLINNVVVTAVVVSSDLSHAKVYVSDILNDMTDKISRLNKAAKFCRYQLAQRIDLRAVPELKFMVDSSLSHGNQLSALINQACADDDAHHNSGEVDDDTQAAN